MRSPLTTPCSGRQEQRPSVHPSSEPRATATAGPTLRFSSGLFWSRLTYLTVLSVHVTSSRNTGFLISHSAVAKSLVDSKAPAADPTQCAQPPGARRQLRTVGTAGQAGSPPSLHDPVITLLPCSMVSESHCGCFPFYIYKYI